MQLVKRQLKRYGKAIIASLLACLVLLLDGLAALPHAHECLHHDANSSQHHCAITIFAQGQVDATSVEVAPATTQNLVEVSLVSTVSTYAPAIENLPAGRAPPVSSSNS